MFLVFGALTQAGQIETIVFAADVVRTYGGTGGGQYCTFPFVYRERRYFSCIDAGHDRPWCATTPNYDTSRQWGNCVREYPCTS